MSYLGVVPGCEIPNACSSEPVCVRSLAVAPELWLSLPEPPGLDLYAEVLSVQLGSQLLSPHVCHATGFLGFNPR